MHMVDSGKLQLLKNNHYVYDDDTATWWLYDPRGVSPYGSPTFVTVEEVVDMDLDDLKARIQRFRY